MVIERDAASAAVPAGPGGTVPAGAGTGAAAGTAAPSVPAGLDGGAVGAAGAGVFAGIVALSALLAGLGGAVPAAAVQAPPVPPSGARAAPEAVVGQRPDGGRDPFVRPAVPDSPAPVETRPAGAAGLAVDEAVLRGVVVTRGGRLAMLEGADARTWVVRRRDRLHDGAVHEITEDAVLFLRDAAGPVPFAERVVRKRLRDTESGR